MTAARPIKCKRPAYTALVRRVSFVKGSDVGVSYFRAPPPGYKTLDNNASIVVEVVNKRKSGKCRVLLECFFSSAFPPFIKLNRKYRLNAVKGIGWACGKIVYGVPFSSAYYNAKCATPHIVLADNFEIKVIFITCFMCPDCGISRLVFIFCVRVAAVCVALCTPINTRFDLKSSIFAEQTIARLLM